VNRLKKLTKIEIGVGGGRIIFDRPKQLFVPGIQQIKRPVFNQAHYCPSRNFNPNTFPATTQTTYLSAKF
jgi:hypothetical protein